MTTLLIIIILLYTIFLNIRIREAEESVRDIEDRFLYEAEQIEANLYNKMMDWRREVKEQLKKKKVEKPRRRSTKSSSKVSKAKVS